MNFGIPKLNMPRWLLISLISLVVAAIIVGAVLLIHGVTYAWIGWALVGLLAAAVILIVGTTGPPLYKLYKFQKYFKKHESTLNMLPSLMQTGRMQEALMRFEGVMKHAPENAYVHYLRANFLLNAGKSSEALNAANKALSMMDKDPFLPMILQQVAGQMDQPSTVEEFKMKLTEIRRSLEPRVSQIRLNKEKAVAKRKKKSRE